MGLRMAYWFGFAAVAGAFGGLIAFGVQHAHDSISNWRLLFIIEVNLSSPLVPEINVNVFVFVGYSLGVDGPSRYPLPA